MYYHDPLSGCPAPIQNFTVNRLAKQIVFTNNRPDGFQTNCTGENSNLYTSIEICEIKVMGKILTKTQWYNVHLGLSKCRAIKLQNVKSWFKQPKISYFNIFTLNLKYFLDRIINTFFQVVTITGMVMDVQRSAQIGVKINIVMHSMVPVRRDVPIQEPWLRTVYVRCHFL